MALLVGEILTDNKLDKIFSFLSLFKCLLYKCLLPALSDCWIEKIKYCA